MNDSVLEKYFKTRPDDDAVPIPENDLADDLGAFGWLRGVRERAIMLEFRRRDGSIKAHSYAWLEAAELDPSEGITLHFGKATVKIIGRNLNAEYRPTVRLFAGIVRHRVPWIQEADEPAALEAPAGAIVIERITLE